MFSSVINPPADTDPDDDLSVGTLVASPNSMDWLPIVAVISKMPSSMSIVAAFDPAALLEVIRKMVLLGKSISNVPLKLELFPPKLIRLTGPVLINRKVPPGLAPLPKAALIVSSVTTVD